jgi:hypothetical protein
MSVSRFIGKLFGRSGRRSVTPARKLSRFRPSLHSLDDRLVPANISTSLVLGNLTLTDNGASSVTISQPAANLIRLTPGAGTTINGQALAVNINGVTGNLSANLGSGNDSVTFDLSQTGIDVGNVSITGGTGDKTVTTMTGGSDNFLTVHGNYRQVFGDGNEFTALNQFKVAGNMTIDHANGGSFVFLKVDPTNRGAIFNSVGGNLVVDNVTANGRAATGFDVNALEETSVGGSVYSNMGNAIGVGGWTTFGSLSDTSVMVGGDVILTAQTGFLAFGDVANKGLEVWNAQIAGGVTMSVGRGVGNSALFGGTTAKNASAANVTIIGQGSHDAVTLGASQIVGGLGVSLAGRGGNSIDVDNVFVGGDTSLKTAGGSNEIRIDDQAPGSTFGGHVDIFMTGRNNFLSINSQHRTPSTGTTTFAGGVMAELGSGGDTLHLGLIGDVHFGAASTFDGGPGHNTAFVGSVSGVQPKIDNFD